MIKTVKNKYYALKYKLGPKYRRSYSQCGEDILVARLLRDMGVSKPSYLDIGTNDPVIFNNTYLFYRNGGHGICVEPNPALCAKIRLKRSRDVCVQAGIGITEGSAAFMIMENDALSTFSDKEAAETSKDGHHIEQRISVPVKTISQIIRENGSPKIDFLSIDTEGLDADILKNADFESFRPKVICVETRSFGDTVGQARSAAESFMKTKGYELAGYTPVNSIFADSRAGSCN